VSVRSFLSDLVRRSHTIRTATIDAALVGGGVVGQRAFGLLTAVAVARAVPTDVFGQYTLFMTFFLLFSQAPLALDGTFIRFANSLHAETDDQRADVFLATSILAKLGWGLIVALAVWLLAPVLAVALWDKPELAAMLRMGAIAGSLQAVGTSLFSRFQQRKNFAMVGILDPVYNAVVLAGVLLVVAFGVPLSIERIFAIYVGAAALYSGGALLVLARSLLPRIGAAIHRMTEFGRIAAILVPASILLVVAERIDVFFIARLITLDDMGRYGAAIRLSALAAMFTGVIATIMMPHAPSAMHDSNRLRSFLRLAGYYCGIQSAIGLILICFSERLGVLAFGPEYGGLRALTALLILQQMFGSYATPFQALIRCGPRPQSAITLSAVRIAISVSLLGLFAPKFGVVGAAAAMALTSAILVGLTAAVALRAARPAAASMGLETA